MVEKLLLESVLHPKIPAFHVSALFAVLHVVSPAPLKFVVKRFVEDAVVAKKFVVVAEVPVAFMKVKFWRVDEPVARMFAVARVPLSV